jgi:hypothetical protein
VLSSLAPYFLNEPIQHVGGLEPFAILLGKGEYECDWPRCLIQPGNASLKPTPDPHALRWSQALRRRPRAFSSSSSSFQLSPVSRRKIFSPRISLWPSSPIPIDDARRRRSYSLVVTNIQLHRLAHRERIFSPRRSSGPSPGRVAYSCHRLVYDSRVFSAVFCQL